MLVVALLIAGAYGMALEERDLVDTDTTMKMMGALRAAIERRSGERVHEERGLLARCRDGCAEVKAIVGVELFGGPQRIQVMLELLPTRGKKASDAVLRDDPDGWPAILDRLVRELLVDTAQPEPLRAFVPEVHAEPQTAAKPRDALPILSLILSASSGVAAGGAVFFALRADSERSELMSQRYVASEVRALDADMRRDSTAAQICLGLAVAGAGAAIGAILLDL